MSQAGLADTLRQIYVRAANAEFANYDIGAIRKAAPELMYRLFDLRRWFICLGVRFDHVFEMSGRFDLDE